MIKTAYYFIIVTIGIAISIPITIVIIAYEQALNDVEAIREHFKSSNQTKK